MHAAALLFAAAAASSLFHSHSFAAATAPGAGTVPNGPQAPTTENTAEQSAGPDVALEGVSLADASVIHAASEEQHPDTADFRHAQYISHSHPATHRSVLGDVPYRRLYGNVVLEPVAEPHSILSEAAAMALVLPFFMQRRGQSSNASCVAVVSEFTSFDCGRLWFTDERGDAPRPTTITREFPLAGAEGASEVRSDTPSIGSLCRLTMRASIQCQPLVQSIQQSDEAVDPLSPPPPLPPPSPPLPPSPSPLVVEVHSGVLDSGLDGKWMVLQHTWHAHRGSIDENVPAHTSPMHAVYNNTVQAEVYPDGEVQPDTFTVPLRIVSYNVWNSNPPKWLWPNPMNRNRMYALRMHHLGDVLRHAGADIFALQEIRHDTGLSGHDKEGAALEELAKAQSFYGGLHVASDWYNRTRAIAELPKYHERNAGKWEAVVGSPLYHTSYGSSHPHEYSHQGNASEVNPYVKGIARGPASYADVIEQFRIWPHAQIHHLAAHLPGYQYVTQPSQLYLDVNGWLGGDRTIDEEGPAIFSKHPIVHSDYLLLSRDGGDEGDGHQRTVLHAVIDVSDLTADSSEGGTLIDVYTVHLSLSERARNRSVVEILSFISHSQRGVAQFLLGDMNAEPNEPALQLLSGQVDLSAHLNGMDADTREPAWQPTAPLAGLPLLRTPHAAGGSTPTNHDTGTSSSSNTAATAASADSVKSGLTDVWPLLHDEPVPRDRDAAARRYAFTFPSDDPCKRIDIIYASAQGRGVCSRRQALEAAGRGHRTSSLASHDTTLASDDTALASDDVASGIGECPTALQVANTFLLGQDPLAGTEMLEGRIGMVSDRSPIWASDHRAVVVDVLLPLA